MSFDSTRDDAISLDDVYPRPAYAWWTVGVLVITYTLSYVDRTVMSLLVVPIRAEFHISDTQMSLLLGLSFAIFYLIMAIPLGRLADRTNRRRLIMIGVVLWTAATVGCGLAPTFLILFITRIGVGIGEASLSPCAFSIMTDCLPATKLARASSIYATGVPIGTGLALIFGGFIVKAAAGHPLSVPVLGALQPWRLVFIAMIVPATVVLALLLTIREPLRRGKPLAAGAKGGYADLFRFIRSHGGGASRIIVGMTLFLIAVQGPLPWLPTFFQRSYGVAASQVGFVLGTLTATCGILGSVSGGMIADFLFIRGHKNAHVMVLVCAAILVTPVLILAPLAPSAQLAYVGISIQIFFTFLPIGVASAALQIISPNRLRGQMAALALVTFGMGALAIGPSLIALITDHVFKNDQALHNSMALMGAVVGPLAALVLASAAKPFALTIRGLAARD